MLSNKQVEHKNITVGGSLIIQHLNIQYIRDKVDILNVYLNLESPDVLIITEHGLKDQEICLLNFPGYNIGAYSCRTVLKSGGVLIITKDNLKVKTIDLLYLFIEKDFEVAGIKINN